MKIDSQSNHQSVWYLPLVLLFCLTVGVISFLILSSRLTLAQTSTDFVIFEETEDELMISIDADTQDGVLNPNEEGAIIWKYIGPSNRENLEFDCHQLSFNNERYQAKHQEIVATAKDNQSQASAKLSLANLPLPSTKLGRQYSYCFEFSYKINTQEGVFHQYRYYTLTEQTLASQYESPVVFEIESPLSGKTIPAGIRALSHPGNEDNDDIDLDEKSWQSLIVADEQSCNQEANWASTDVQQINQRLVSEDLNTVYCFKVTNQAAADQASADIFTAVKMNTNLSDGSNNDDNTKESSVNWIIWAVLGGVLLIIIIGFLVMKKSSKNPKKPQEKTKTASKKTSLKE